MQYAYAFPGRIRPVFLLIHVLLKLLKLLKNKDKREKYIWYLHLWWRHIQDGGMVISTSLSLSLYIGSILVNAFFLLWRSPDWILTELYKIHWDSNPGENQILIRPQPPCHFLAPLKDFWEISSIKHPSKKCVSLFPEKWALSFKLRIWEQRLCYNDFFLRTMPLLGPLKRWPFRS